MNTIFVVPTSNVLERFFSIAKYTFDDLRRSLLPKNLEMQLFLYINREYWSEETVSLLLKKE